MGTESLCIGLINSYSSSAWHPGKEWVCPWANLQACGRQPIHQSPVRLHTTNFLGRLKKQGDAREKERVIEGGIDDIEGEMGGWEGEKKVRGAGSLVLQ